MKNRKNRIILYYFILIAFLFLMVCSRSSFLYPCNDWNDANSFFTMGKAMMKGQVLYRDLFEQKGPYLYLIYGIGYLLSHQSFLGIFVLEVIALTIFLAASYQSMTLYCSDKTALILIPLLAAGTVSSKSFYWGGSAEEFCLPLLAISLYCTLRYFKEEYPQMPKATMLFWNGILAGSIALIKYTILGFYIAWIAILVFSVILRKKWKNAIYSCLVFLGGMLSSMLPWFIYFGMHGALRDWYECYIYNNIFLYSNLGKACGLGKRIYDLAKILYYLILDNWMYFILIIIGIFFFAFTRKTRWYEKINVILMAGTLFIGIYIGGANLPYYSIPLIPFAVLGMIALGQILEKYLVALLSTSICIFITGFSITLGIVGAYRFSMNTNFLFTPKEDFFLYQLKNVIDEEENPTLLNYGCLDVGLYTVTGIMPNCRFYHTCNLDYPLMEEEQLRYIEEGKTQFIITNVSYSDNIGEKYELVKEVSYMHFGEEVKYYLFKRI